MLLRDVMTPNPITVRPDTDYLAAIAIMRAGKFRHLPVIDSNEMLVGILSDRDLANVKVKAPTQRDITEGGTLMRVHEVMHRGVVTAPPDYPVEEAAMMMIERRISSLPVVEEGRVIGILTDSDLFHLFAEILGGRSASIRITVRVANRPGQLAALAGCVASVGGNIMSIASCPSNDPNVALFVLRVERVSSEELQQAIREEAEILHVWNGEQP